MKFHWTARSLIAVIVCAVLLAALILLLGVMLTWSAPSSAAPPSSHVPDRVGPYNELAYDKPIIFFDEHAQILVFYPNGDIIHRGRKVTTDRAVVRALQEILSLSPCRQHRDQPQSRPGASPLHQAPDQEARESGTIF